MASSDITIFRENTMVLYITSLWNSLTDLLMTGAVVQVTVTDDAGVELSGVVWPIAATEPTPGNYQISIPAELETVDIDRGYTLVDITQGGIAGAIKQGTVFKNRTFENRGR